MAKLAFLGLGVMGFPMAGHLAARGHDVNVYNRTAAKAQIWLTRHAGRSAPTPRKAARGQDFVFACVGNDGDLSEVTLGPSGAFDGMDRGAIFVDHTTASAGIARELSAAAQALGLGFLDAPISLADKRGAESGKLTVMAGGERAVFDRAAPVIASYAKTSRLLGPAGSGQLAKMMNQIAIAGIVQGLAEAMHFGKAAGLDVEAAIAVISQGAAQSWQMDNRHGTMLAANTSMASPWSGCARTLPSRSPRRAATTPACL